MFLDMFPNKLVSGFRKFLDSCPKGRPPLLFPPSTTPRSHPYQLYPFPEHTVVIPNVDLGLVFSVGSSTLVPLLKKPLVKGIKGG